MTRKNYIASIALVATMALTTVGVAQSARPITWSQDLEYLQKLPPAEASAQQGAIDAIRAEVERWVKLHPEKKVTLAAAPARPWTTEQTQAQIKSLSEALSVLAADEAHPFHLGQTDVAVSGTVSPLSPTAVSIDQAQLRATNTLNLTAAVDQLPGVEVSHASNKRNESTYYLRGFNQKEVPLYLDGVPQYIPYDGNLDLNRFLISDLAEVQVTRGYTSSLLGPNALAGSINMVSREPQKPYEAEAMIGTGSGNQLNASGRIGRRAKLYFLQGGIDWAQRDYVVLPGKFVWDPSVAKTLTTSNYLLGTNQYPYTYSRDEKYSGRIGWTPRSGDEYVFSYVDQKGKKDALAAIGPFTSSGNSWTWPFWDKTSYYFLSNTNLGAKNNIKTRVFYDSLRNGINMFDDISMTTLLKPSSEYSRYDDHADGASVEFHTNLVPRNKIGVSFYFKDDTHHEWGVYQPQAVTPIYAPWITIRDQQTSYGIEDLITISPRLHVTGGFSIDHINGMKAQTYDSNYVVIPYTCLASPTNTSYSGCTPHFTEYNPQVSATYNVTSSDTASVSFSRRGRFPVMKEMYSGGMGTTVPNPNLSDEHANNWNFGYTHVFNPRYSADIQLYRSDLTDAIISATIYTSSATQCPSTKTTKTVNGKKYYGCSYNWNAGKTTNEGVELHVSARPLDRLNMEAQYAYLNRFLGSSETTPPGVDPTKFDGGADTPRASINTGLPRNKLAILSTITGPHGVIGTIRQRYEGGIVISDSGTAAKAVHPTGYWSKAMYVMDLNVKVPIYKGLEAQGGVNNAFDRYYYYSSGYPEAGRNWFFNLRYQY